MGANYFHPVVLFGVGFYLKQINKLLKHEKTIPFPIYSIETYTHSRTECESLENYLDRCDGFIGFIVKEDIPFDTFLQERQKFLQFLEEKKELLNEFNIVNHPYFTSGSICSAADEFIDEDEEQKYTETCDCCEKNIDDEEEENLYILLKLNEDLLYCADCWKKHKDEMLKDGWVSDH